MEYMDLLPPTAPSLVFARETCMPYNKTGKGNNKSKDGFGSVTHTNSEREESCNAKTAQLNPYRGITQLETILSMTKKNTKVLFL